MTVVHNSSIIVGSSPTLTCIVKFSENVDLLLNVFTTWTGPNSTVLTQTHQGPAVMVNQLNSTYSSMATADAAKSGNYTCEVSVNSTSPFITDRKELMSTGIAAIIVGKY